MAEGRMRQDGAGTSGITAPPRATGASLLGLVLLIGVSLLAMAIGGGVTNQSLAVWYDGLRKPPFNPPGWAFGVVWPILYVAMAVAAWLVWRARGLTGARVALTLYAVQLALNVLWSLFFFGMRNPGLALLDILALLVAIVATMRAFAPISRAAAWLLAPYLAWVAFATVLNAWIWWYN